MGRFNRHYFTDSQGKHLEHRAAYGTANSTSNEKGTDNKKNNTSQYNHEYYMKHKEKWTDYKSRDKNDKDFDDGNFDEKNRIPGTNLYSFKNADGKTVIASKDHKWVLPEGELTPELKKKLQDLITNDHYDPEKISSLLNEGKSGGKEFDVDAAARDVISGKYKNGAERKAALGDDYELVQKRVNEMLKGKKNSSSKSNGSSSSNKKLRTISEAASDYNKTKTKSSSSVKSDVTARGKKQTAYYKKQKNSIKHDDMDYGSILISDLMGGN